MQVDCCNVDVMLSDVIKIEHSKKKKKVDDSLQYNERQDGLYYVSEWKVEHEHNREVSGRV